MSEISSARSQGGHLPARRVQDRQMQTERWAQYLSSESSRVGKRRLISQEQAQTMRLKWLTSVRQSGKRWRRPRLSICATFLRHKRILAARRDPVTQGRTLV